MWVSVPCCNWSILYISGNKHLWVELRVESQSSLIRLICFWQRFVLVLTAFRMFWYTYICFHPNYRTVVVGSIQMLIAQRILDMAYFCHYHYYGHLLSIIKICNPGKTCSYGRPVSVIINSNTGSKCWPCRGRTPSWYYQAFITENTDSTIFAWILDVSQLKNGLNKKFRHEYYCQSSQNIYDHIFNCW